MKNKFLNIVATTTLATLLTVGAVFAATTIGTNIETGGTLDVTGVATITGATALNGGLTMDTNKFIVADTTGNTTIAGTLAVDGATATLGNSTADTVILNGRLSTSSVAGAALDLGATYLTPQLWEIRANVSDWTMADNFTGAYFRFGNTSKTTAYNLKGMEVNVSSDKSVKNLQGLYVESQAKAVDTNSTWTSIQGIESNLSFYDQTNTVGVTEAKAFYGTIGLGSGYTAYTGIHGMILETRDGSVGTRTLGSGILLRNISPAEGTQTWTKGIQLAMAATTGISLEGAMTTGIDIAGASTYDIQMQNNERIMNSTDGSITFATDTANADTLSIAPKTGGGAAIAGVLTSADLTTGTKTWTFPDVSGTVVVSGGITVSAGANTACTTTCAGGTTCLVGLDAATTFVACNSALADSCLCTTP